MVGSHGDGRQAAELLGIKLNGEFSSLTIAIAQFSFSWIHNKCQVVSPDPRMSVGPTFRHQTQKGGEGARAERNMAVGFKAVELVSF